MKTLPKNLLLTITLFSFGCKRDEFNAKLAAKQYCDCLQTERQAGADFFDGRTKCDGEMIVENRFFRLDYIGFSHGSYMLLLPDKLKDSLAKFHSEFYEYVENHCCKQGFIGCDGGDSLQNKMKAIDTLCKKNY